MTLSQIKSRTIILLFTLASLTLASVFIFQNRSSASGFFGAIYTSTFDGSSVNENNYSSKDAVYINGGPQNEDVNGLPDGAYYFQVTNPSGSILLSTDNAVCRQVLVAFGKIAAADGPACQHMTGLPNSSNGSTPVQLAPYADTPNNGSEYKVWLIRQTSTTTIAADGKHLNFRNSDAKTDNFKVVSAPCTDCSPESVLSGHKFYDANQNALFDGGEAPVAGVKIAIDVTFNGDTSTVLATTDESGNWSIVVPTGATYKAGEYIPNTATEGPGSFWQQTSPLPDGEGFQGYGGSANGNHTGLDFGNVCYDSHAIVSPTPCSVSYQPPPTPEPTETPEPTPTPTPCTDCPTATLSGKKFYDTNANGAFDDGEDAVQGVRIAVLVTTSAGTTTTVATTNADGNWSLSVLVGATYLIGEYVPDTDRVNQPDAFWEQTSPAADDEGFRGYKGTVTGDQSGFNFGDICYLIDSDGNISPSGSPCTVSYPPSTNPTPTPTPDNQ